MLFHRPCAVTISERSRRWWPCGRRPWCLVDPRADVSILDDWCYAISVEQILNGQGFHVSPWSSTFPPGAALVGHALRVARRLFVHVAPDVDADALARWDARVRTAASASSVRERARRCSAPSAVPLLYPIGFVLAFSFMSDISFVAFALLSLAMLAGGLRRARERTIVAGLGLSFVAFFVRPGRDRAAGGLVRRRLRARVDRASPSVDPVSPSRRSS